MAHDEKMLCPFKKGTARELNRKTGKVELTERFMPCAGTRCMAFRDGHPPRCTRLDETQKQSTRIR